MKLNWFKKQPTIVEAQKETLQIENEVVVTSKDIQEDLHKSFQDVLSEFDLKESKETEIDNLKLKLESFKKENTEIYNKIEILNNLGLSSTPTATKSLEKLKSKEADINKNIQQLNSQIEKVNKIKELTLKYSIEYPCYKFINNETMIKIMHKYDLVLGEAFMYSREIPSENLEIINNFSKEIKSSEKTIQLIEENHYTFRTKYYNIREKSKQNINEDIKGFWIKDPCKSYDETIVKEFKVSKFKMIAPENHFTIPTYNMSNFRRENIEVPLLVVNKDRKYEFTTKQINEVEKKKREVLDPIACLEVEGGYIIMSAWDKEAEIPEIKNTFLN